MKASIGKGTNSPCELDVDKLITSRMLIQASSGGGFGNAIGHLCSLGLLERVGSGDVQMNPAIYHIP